MPSGKSQMLFREKVDLDSGKTTATWLARFQTRPLLRSLPPSNHDPPAIAGGPPAPPGLPPFFADFARVFPDIGTRFRRFSKGWKPLSRTFPDIGTRFSSRFPSAFPPVGRGWKPHLRKVGLPLPGVRHLAAPRNVFFAMGILGAQATRLRNGLSRAGRPRPRVRPHSSRCKTCKIISGLGRWM